MTIQEGHGEGPSYLLEMDSKRAGRVPANASVFELGNWENEPENSEIHLCLCLGPDTLTMWLWMSHLISLKLFSCLLGQGQ